jgi:hypothetical protein
MAAVPVPAVVVVGDDVAIAVVVGAALPLAAADDVVATATPASLPPGAANPV